MACCAACLITSGALKSGNPCARLIAFASMASRVISRMTDSVNLEVRLLRNLALWFESVTGRTDVFCAEGVIKEAYHAEISLDSGIDSRVHTGCIPCPKQHISGPASWP